MKNWTDIIVLGGMLLSVAVIVQFGVWHGQKRLREMRGFPEELFTTKPNFTFQKQLLRAAEKIALEETIPPDEPPLAIGDQCLLLGDLVVEGSGLLTVVDGDETEVVVSWDDGYQEKKLSRAIVRRYRDEGGGGKRKMPVPPKVLAG